ncbi:MAG TPA: S26 family signal peptidase [Thermoplasmata archaeon]|nr:S26 family signal peptidase [Thermoplasmata archaeon]
MPKEEPAPRTPKEEDGDGWKSWVRDIAIAVLIMAVILGAIYAYTGVWPPLVVVESDSMQHSATTSYVGVIDTGDLVFVQAAPTRADVVTYVQGRATGYATYGDYGDVIIFRLFNRPQDTPIIHRAILYVIPNGTSTADVPDLGRLPPQDWVGTDAAGRSTHVPYHLESVEIFDMGYRHLNVTFVFSDVAQFFFRGPGYVTMGDHNAPTYDIGWFPIQGDIIGHARGEIPWFGLIKLLLSPSPNCCQGWGDPRAPANSWTNLALSIAFLIALPFILEALGWVWGKYAWPRLRPLLRRRAKPERPEEPEAPPEDLSDEDTEDEPKEGSSGP